MTGMNKETTKYTGPGLATLLTILFVALKLLGKITWKWIWVISPIWIEIALVIVIALIVAIVTALVDK